MLMLRKLLDECIQVLVRARGSAQFVDQDGLALAWQIILVTVVVFAAVYPGKFISR